MNCKQQRLKVQPYAVLQFLQEPFNDDFVHIRSVELGLSFRRSNDLKTLVEVGG